MNFLCLNHLALSEAPFFGAKSKGYDPVYFLRWNHLVLSEAENGPIFNWQT